MPSQQGVRLDNEKGLLPEPRAAGQEDHTNAIAVGELRSFHLALEHNELLSQYHISGDKVGAAAAYV
jgi:hypothetical protein